MAKPQSVSEALAKLHVDGIEGEEAFEYLYQDGSRLLTKYLTGRVARFQDAEDIPQQIFVKILESRQRLNFATKGEWYSYLHVAARNARKGLKVPGPPITGREKAGCRTASIIIDTVIREGLYELADDLWLGPKPEDFTAKILAVKLLLDDSHPVEEVLPLVALYTSGASPATEIQLWQWLNDLRVIRQMAFDALNLSNKDLANHLIQMAPGDPTGKATSNSLGSSLNAPWSAVEIEVIQKRYGNGISLHSVGDHLLPKLETIQVFNICARCVALFPFEKKMVDLWRKTEVCSLRNKALSKNDLWKRLCFQFTHVNHLIQDDIIERLAPAAAVAGYKLKNINTWVAERFETDLAKYAKKLGVKVGT